MHMKFFDDKAKTIVKTTILGICVFALTFTGLLASYTSEFEAVNKLSFDTVDISLADSLSESEEEKALVSDSTVSHTLTITNDGAECFIRCRSIYVSELGSCVSTRYSGIDESLWCDVGDGYLYYVKPLAFGESLFLEEEISTPKEWIPTTENPQGFLLVTDFAVEAIQAQNFAPDFSSHSPWGDSVVEECLYSRSYMEGK